jgi:hypothetical protein
MFLSPIYVRPISPNNQINRSQLFEAASSEATTEIIAAPLPYFKEILKST